MKANAMRVLPAVDLREGACVQLVGGSYEKERVRLEDPERVAAQWAQSGFRHLHVVDLDAATGRGDNLTLVEALCRTPGLEVQVGGGVKTEERIQRLLQAGAARVVVGTRAIEDEEWREKIAKAYPSKLVIAADVRGRNIVTHGWAKTLDLDVIDLVEELNSLPLAGVLATAVHVEGKMQGPDLPLMAELAKKSRWALYASGGISSLADLKALNDKDVFAVVIGMALYTGALDPAEVAKEYAS